MEHDQALYRSLGVIEGKLDSLLANVATNREATDARLDEQNKRISALEIWKGKATAAISVALFLMNGVWSAVTFVYRSP
jgi:hypothetical protein